MIEKAVKRELELKTETGKALKCYFTHHMLVIATDRSN